MKVCDPPKSYLPPAPRFRPLLFSFFLKKATLHQFFYIFPHHYLKVDTLPHLEETSWSTKTWRPRRTWGPTGRPLQRGELPISLYAMIALGHFQVGDLLQPVANLVGDVTRDLHKLVDPKVDQYDYHHHHHHQSYHHNSCNHHPRPAQAG